jgi:nucleotide-binding universal stress UspA family protein
MSGEDDQRETVLIALDGSPAAATAVPIARLAATRLGAALNVLYVAPQETADAEVRRQLGLDAGGLRGVAVRTALGDPAREILRAAADPRVVLLVLTTHGRMPAAPRPMGHVAEAVVAGAERPVLLVRPAAAIVPGLDTGRQPRLLVPLDGTPSTAAALPPVMELARRLGGSLDCLVVVTPGGREAD